MLKELKMVILLIIKNIALRLLLFYEEHVDINNSTYKQDLINMYPYLKQYVERIEELKIGEHTNL